MGATTSPNERPNRSDTWYTIVTLEGDEYDALVEPQAASPRHLTDEDVDIFIDHLAQWDFGSETEHTPLDSAPWGANDDTYTRGGYSPDYTLIVNDDLRYISLARHPLPHVGGSIIS